jgi:hypothetical protein
LKKLPCGSEFFPVLGIKELLCSSEPEDVLDHLGCGVGLRRHDITVAET